MISRGKSLSRQLPMQNPEITFDNVMQDSSGATLFARSNMRLSNLIEKIRKTNYSINGSFNPTTCMVQSGCLRLKMVFIGVKFLSFEGKESFLPLLPWLCFFSTENSFQRACYFQKK